MSFISFFVAASRESAANFILVSRVLTNAATGVEVFVLCENILATVWRSSHFCRMNFPQFWARGQSGDFFCWRWSSQNIAEAQSLANQAAQQLADRFRAGDYPPKHGGGYYPNRPFREQVIQEIKNDAGETTVVVTRNSYGCLVLNIARVMFVDIDLPEPKRPGGLFKRLFGRPDLTPPINHQEVAMTRIENGRAIIPNGVGGFIGPVPGCGYWQRKTWWRLTLILPMACLRRWGLTHFTGNSARPINVFEPA
jgi:hypothetical protein